MNRIRLFLVITLFALTFTLVGTAAAQPRGPQRPNGPSPRVTWSTPRLVETLNPGETRQINLTLTSNVDLSDVALVLPEALGAAVSVQPATIGQLRAGTATNVQLIISMPADSVRNYAGVVQVRAGERAVPMALRVQVRLPRTP